MNQAINKWVIAICTVGSTVWGASWEGTINSHRFYVPDMSREVRGVLINNTNDWAGGASGDLFTNADWRAVALKHNLVLTEWNSRYNSRDECQTAVTEIVATLTQAATTLQKPEIKYTAIFPQGLSGTACDAAWIASFPEFSGRVGGVILHHEADVEAPAGVPAIYIGDGQDQFGKCCDITQIETVAGYAMAGHPATVSFEPGQVHHIPAVDEKFVCMWIDEMINLRFPSTIPTTQNIVLPDWNNKTAWIGGYTSSSSSESPWNGGRRPINVWISDKSSYTGSEKWIWLPSQRVAQAWKTFMETGVFPTDATPPTQAPTGIAATSTDHTVTLTWSAVAQSADAESGITGYAIYKGSTKMGTTAGTVFSDSGLSPATAYSYQITAINGASLESAKSSPATAVSTTSDVTPPTVVSVFTSGSGLAVSVVFNEALDATTAETAVNYTISSQIPVSSAVFNADQKSVTLTTTQLSEGPTYSLTVKNVKDISGNAISSASVPFTFQSALPLPAGVIKILLQLETSQSSPYLSGNETSFATAASKSKEWQAGEIVTIDGAVYTWQKSTSPDGMWVSETAKDNFIALGAIAINNPTARSAKVNYRHDDDFTVFMNGSQVAGVTGWDGGSEQASSSFMLPAGLSTFVFMLKELTGGNGYSVRFTDNNGSNLTDLGYRIGTYSSAISRPIAYPPGNGGFARITVEHHTRGNILHVNAAGSFTAEIMTLGGRRIHAMQGMDEATISLSATLANVCVVRVTSAAGQSYCQKIQIDR